MLSSLLFLALMPSVQAACPMEQDQLAQALSSTTEEYIDLELDSFHTSLSNLEEDLGCLGQVISPGDAAHLHLLQALRAFVAGDHQAALTALRGLLAVEPGFTLSQDIAPMGNQLHSLLEQAQAEPALESTALPTGWVILDGESGIRELPLERVAVVQRFGDSGALESWYLVGEQAAGWQGSNQLSTAELLTALAPPQTDSFFAGHSSRSLLLGALTSGVLGGAGLIVANQAKGTYSDLAMQSDPSQEELQRSYNTNLGFGIPGYGLVATAAGLSVFAVLRGEW